MKSPCPCPRRKGSQTSRRTDSTAGVSSPSCQIHLCWHLAAPKALGKYQPWHPAWGKPGSCLLCGEGPGWARASGGCCAEEESPQSCWHRGTLTWHPSMAPRHSTPARPEAGHPVLGSEPWDNHQQSSSPPAYNPSMVKIPKSLKSKDVLRKLSPGQHRPLAFAAPEFKPWGPDAPPPAVGGDGPLQT